MTTLDNVNCTADDDYVCLENTHETLFNRNRKHVSELFIIKEIDNFQGENCFFSGEASQPTSAGGEERF